MQIMHSAQKIGIFGCQIQLVAENQRHQRKCLLSGQEFSRLRYDNLSIGVVGRSTSNVANNTRATTRFFGAGSLETELWTIRTVI